jgi:hypothetical protein
MDLLESLNITSLPEQQTRLSHHPNVNHVLSENTNVCLGFDVCCFCARRLSLSSSEDEAEMDPLKTKTNVPSTSSSDTVEGVSCPRCTRVRYCSQECLKLDADPAATPCIVDKDGLIVDEDEEEKDSNSLLAMMTEAGGHSPTVCSLLRLCAIDEQVEEEMMRPSQDRNKAGGNKKNGKSSNKNPPHHYHNDTKHSRQLQRQKECEVAQRRIVSELESYPATLANILKDGPCFKLPLRKQQNQTLTPLPLDKEKACNAISLTIHIVGSSMGSELWPSSEEVEEGQSQPSEMSSAICPRSPGNEEDRTQERLLPYNQAYTQALTDTLIETYTSLKVIRLVFVGPDCPKLKKTKVCRVKRQNYNEQGERKQNNHPDPDPHGLLLPGGAKRKRGLSFDRTKGTSTGGANKAMAAPESPKPASCQYVPHPRHESHTECRVVFETCTMKYEDMIAMTAKKSKKEKTSASDIGPAPARPDIVVMFNPGLTCPDYAWGNTLNCIAPGTPFMVTTNTEMEALADLQFLHESKYIAALPRTAAEIIDGDLSNSCDSHSIDDYDGRSSSSSDKEDEEDELGFQSRKKGLNEEENDLATKQMMFFGENPYCGLRVRQSGNMANDLFVKNRWMFGGIWGGGGISSIMENERNLLPGEQQTSLSNGNNEEKMKRRHKHKVRGSDANSKQNNPALI